MEVLMTCTQSRTVMGPIRVAFIEQAHQFSPEGFPQGPTLTECRVFDVVKVVLQLHTRLNNPERRATGS